MPSFKRDGSFQREIGPHSERAFSRPPASGRPAASAMLGDGVFHPSPLAGITREIAEIRTKEIDAEVDRRLSERAEKLVAESSARGYQEGLQKGRDEAYAARAPEIEALIQRLGQAVDAIEGARAQVFKDNEKILLRICIEAAKRVALKEIANDGEYVQRLLTDTLSGLGTRESIRIRIRPEDRDAIQSLAEGVAKRFPDLKNVTIEASEDVKDCGFVVETELEAIDATVATQLDSLKALADNATAAGSDAGER